MRALISTNPKAFDDEIYYEFYSCLGCKYDGYSQKTSSKFEYLHKSIANDHVWGIAA